MTASATLIPRCSTVRRSGPAAGSKVKAWRSPPASWRTIGTPTARGVSSAPFAATPTHAARASAERGNPRRRTASLGEVIAFTSVIARILPRKRKAPTLSGAGDPEREARHGNRLGLRGEPFDPQGEIAGREQSRGKRHMEGTLGVGPQPRAAPERGTVRPGERRAIGGVI